MFRTSTKYLLLSVVSVCGAGQHLPHQHAAATQELHPELLFLICLHLSGDLRERGGLITSDASLQQSQNARAEKLFKNSHELNEQLITR